MFWHPVNLNTWLGNFSNFCIILTQCLSINCKCLGSNRTILSLPQASASWLQASVCVVMNTQTHTHTHIHTHMHTQKHVYLYLYWQIHLKDTHTCIQMPALQFTLLALSPADLITVRDPCSQKKEDGKETKFAANSTYSLRSSHKTIVNHSGPSHGSVCDYVTALKRIWLKASCSRCRHTLCLILQAKGLALLIHVFIALGYLAYGFRIPLFNAFGMWTTAAVQWFVPFHGSLRFTCDGILDGITHSTSYWNSHHKKLAIWIWQTSNHTSNYRIIYCIEYFSCQLWP